MGFRALPAGRLPSDRCGAVHLSSPLGRRAAITACRQRRIKRGQQRVAVGETVPQVDDGHRGDRRLPVVGDDVDGQGAPWKFRRRDLRAAMGTASRGHGPRVFERLRPPHRHRRLFSGRDRLHARVCRRAAHSVHTAVSRTRSRLGRPSWCCRGEGLYAGAGNARPSPSALGRTLSAWPSRGRGPPREPRAVAPRHGRRDGTCRLVLVGAGERHHRSESARSWSRRAASSSVAQHHGHGCKFKPIRSSLP